MTASSRRKYIICLDTALLVIFLLLLSPRMTGLAIHEVLGFVFFVPLVVHLLISWRWIQNSVRKFFKTATRRSRFNFFLNAILFILAITELVSGSFISQVVLPGLGMKTINDRLWRSVHNETLNYTVLFAGFHVAVNWAWIASVFRKRLNAAQQGSVIFSPKVMTTLLRIIILLFATGIVAFILYGILGKPSLARLYNQNEMERFRPTFGHGIIQFLGEASLIALYVFVARKWLRMRL
jgi:hypothetical protein